MEYLFRVAAITGYTISDLIGQPLRDDRPVRILNTKFPKVLDILPLYVLCGVDKTNPHLTVKGYKKIYAKDGRDAVAPLSGFHNYCMTVCANPKEVVPFQPNIWQIRKVVRDIFLSGLSRPEKFVTQFAKIEEILRKDVVRILTMALADDVLADKLQTELQFNMKHNTLATPSAENIADTANGYALLRLVKFCQRNHVRDATKEEILSLFHTTDEMTKTGDREIDNEDW
jgi:hypothetical protein